MTFKSRVSLCALWFFLVGAVVLPGGLRAADAGVSFYFSPHPDDWQLFMNPNAAHDVGPAGYKVVFVFVTAGDGGNGSGAPAGLAHPYYVARENGARMSVRFIADDAQDPVSGVDSSIPLNGHTVARYQYRNTVSYFLRLYDGSTSGGGYASTGYQSLQGLEAGRIPALGAVDQSAAYTSWSDLADTVHALVVQELGHCAGGWVNLPDPDGTKNPEDHPDHIATARLVLDAMAGMPYLNRVYYVDYAAAEMPDNLGADDTQVKVATYAQVVAALTSFGYAGHWDSTHRAWLGKSYFRVEPTGAATTCSGLRLPACGSPPCPARRFPPAHVPGKFPQASR